MFCDKCGAGLKGDEYNCPICGKQLKEGAPQEPNPNNNVFAMPTTTKAELETNAALEAEKHNAKVNKMKGFLSKHKKLIIAVIAIIVLAIAGYVIFDHVYDYTKISWKDTEDSNISFTGPRKISLSVDAHGKNNSKIDDIKYEVTGGEIIASEGQNVEWQLPSETGNYVITAIAPSGKKITKNIKVYILNDTKEPLFDVREVEESKDEDDDDNDGLTNKQEKEYNTNPKSADTDKDGLIDKYEIETSKTDPNKYDSDEDGISDGDEVLIELDPLKADSKGDGIKDGDRSLTYTKKNDKTGVEIEITGKGNIVSTTVDVLENSTFADMEGVLNKVYNFYTKGNLTNAKVTIPYTVEELTAKGLTEDDLTLYYFNEDTKKLEAVETEVDKNNKVLIVNLSHFSKYVVGNKSLVLDDYSSDILFVIDNSVSMYTTEQMVEAGYNSSTGAVGNDKNFERIKLTKNMIDKFTGNYRFSIAEFAGNYKSIISFTKEREEVKNKADSLKSNWTVSLTGTNIIDALKSGTQVFSPTDKNGHYLILMTDGKNTSGNLSSNKNSIISLAKQHNVKICVIGLGKDLDNDVLSSIAKETGCDYYSVSEASALEKVYENVGAQINYNLVDTDGDGKTDGTIVVDSGFITQRDGFAFENFRTNESEGGNCYGMAVFAALRYQKELPLKRDDKFFKRTRLVEQQAYSWNLTGTYFADYSKNLHDYEFKDEMVDMYFNRKRPDDYRNGVKNGVYKLSSKYYDLFTERGFEVRTYDYVTDDFNAYEDPVININYEGLKTYDNTSYQMVRSLHWFWASQNYAEKSEFHYDPDDTYNILVEKLKAKNPVVLGTGTHAINAIRLIQDNENPNEFKIEIYDSNCPDEARYIHMTRTETHWYDFNYTRWTNDYYYTFTYDKDYDGVEKELELSVYSEYGFDKEI